MTPEICFLICKMMRFGQVMSMIYQLEMLKWNGFFLWQVSLPLEMIKSEA